MTATLTMMTPAEIRARIAKLEPRLAEYEREERNYRLTAQVTGSEEHWGISEMYGGWAADLNDEIEELTWKLEDLEQSC